MKKILFLFGLVIVLGRPIFASGKVDSCVADLMIETQSQEFSELIEEYYQWKIHDDPLTESYHTDHKPRANFFQREPREIQQRKLILEGFSARARKLDIAKLTPDEVLNWKIFVDQLDVETPLSVFQDYLPPTDSMVGFDLLIPDSLNDFVLKTENDYLSLIEMYKNVPDFFETNIQKMEEQTRKGVVLPTKITERVLARVTGMIGMSYEKSPFFSPFLTRPAEITESQWADIVAKASEVVQLSVYPSYENLVNYLKSKYLPKSRDTHGLAALPRGNELYAALVRKQTGTNLNPAEVHEIGLREISRIKKEIQKTLVSMGRSTDIKQEMENLKKLSGFYFESREAMLEQVREVVQRSSVTVKKIIEQNPAVSLKVDLVPEFQEASSPFGYYMPGSIDVGRSGVFMINLYQATKKPRWDAEVIALHEGIPGHHTQMMLADEHSKGLPSFRKLIYPTSLVEGWALYAETLGKDMGFYTDPMMYLGKLNLELWRANRLALDTGIHAFGWTRSEAIAFGKDNSIMSEIEIEKEVDRFASVPAQALAYKIGELKILELRKLAEKKLGNRFDVKKFHGAILTLGQVPLSILEEQLRIWIEAQSVK